MSTPNIFVSFAAASQLFISALCCFNVAALASGQVPAPATPSSRPPLGTKPAPARAQIEAEAVVMTPLVKGARVWSDRDYEFVYIPPGLEGVQFTQSRAHAKTLHFKVLSDGVVEMACTTRFAESDPEAMTDEKLRRKGWHRKRGVELRDGQPGYVWWVYSRQCKAGEKFGYHTEKYAAPFLLVR